MEMFGAPGRGRRRVVPRVVAVVALAAVVGSCYPPPNEMAVQLGGPPTGEEKTTVDLRVLQTRRFDTLDERRLLLAATQTLQDLGFTVTESVGDVGVIVASKQRDAVESGQVAGQVVLTLLFAAMGSAYSPVWDKAQNIVVTLVTVPVRNSSRTDVRVSFDRRITNSDGHQWRTELILEPKVYQEFFDKFSQSVFLEAHKL